jgi:hypothetical protein
LDSCESCAVSFVDWGKQDHAAIEIGGHDVEPKDAAGFSLSRPDGTYFAGGTALILTLIILAGDRRKEDAVTGRVLVDVVFMIFFFC